MKERYLSKTYLLTFVYISKCNINLPCYFGNSKKRFLWTGLMYTYSYDGNAHEKVQQSLRPSLPLCWGRNRGGPACDTPTASIPESLLTLPALLSSSSRLAINVIVIISESHFSLLFGREMRCAKTLVRQCIAIQVCHSKCFSMCAYEY